MLTLVSQVSQQQSRCCTLCNSHDSQQGNPKAAHLLLMLQQQQHLVLQLAGLVAQQATACWALAVMM
jgi:hypothetical protein